MGFNLTKNYATEATLEVEGAWIDADEGVRFLIARAGNKKFNALILRLAEKNKASLKGRSEAAQSKSDTIMIEVMSETILKGWDGPLELDQTDADGKVTTVAVGPFTVEKAAGLLAIKDFREWVDAQSKDMANYQKATQEEAKNS